MLIYNSILLYLKVYSTEEEKKKQDPISLSSSLSSRFALPHFQYFSCLS